VRDGEIPRPKRIWKGAMAATGEAAAVLGWWLVGLGAWA
jgi:hypothetical protein